VLPNKVPVFFSAPPVLLPKFPKLNAMLAKRLRVRDRLNQGGCSKVSEGGGGAWSICCRRTGHAIEAGETWETAFVEVGSSIGAHVDDKENDGLRKLSAR
jgi:hypothetical protein